MNSLFTQMRRLKRTLRTYLQPFTLQTMETDAGVKYRGGSFDSSRFQTYVRQEILLPETGAAFADLLIPPDLLRDKYAVCGQSILASPHYQLVEHILTGKLTSHSDYIVRAQAGTLDNRLPETLDLDSLTRKCHQLERAVSESTIMPIFVVKIEREGKAKFVIADGKHRAALLAYLDRPELLMLRVISPTFIQAWFFNRIYSFVMTRDATEYSINQTMIRSLKDEC